MDNARNHIHPSLVSAYLYQLVTLQLKILRYAICQTLSKCWLSVPFAARLALCVISKLYFVRTEGITVNMKITVFCDVMPCSLVPV
jgi:hypothetical protein